MMQIRNLAYLLVAVGVPIFAHHQFSSEYDKSKPVTLTGTVNKVTWASPHVEFTLDVKNQAGKTEEWRLEAASPNYLTKHGIKATSFEKGKMVTVSAYRATDNSTAASARLFTDSSGKKLQVCDPAEDGGPAK